MAGDGFDISLLGDKLLERKLARLGKSVQQGKALRPPMRASIKRLRGYIVNNLSGHPVAPDTGRYRDSMAVARPIPIKRSRSGPIGFTLELPDRWELGIPQEAKKKEYPVLLEYGWQRVPAKAPIRRAVDDHADAEHATIARAIGKRIEALAAKKR